MNSLPTAGWYSELCHLWPGQCMSIEVEKCLHEEKSEFQKIEVMQTKTYGKMLCLDGIIQLTERDEFSYQEMLAFVSLFSHPDPKTVCIIGGGDGAVLTRVAMHPGVKEIVLCELDEKVISNSKKYFPQFNRGFDDPRTTVVFKDGHKYLQEHENHFDVIITDSSDPIGPADSLFSTGYYNIVHKALTENGVSVSQGECMWLHLDLVHKLVTSCKDIFPHVRYGNLTIPTYPSGCIGILACSKTNPCDKPMGNINETLSAEDAAQIKYYTPEMHSASFILPKFVVSRLNSSC